MNKKTPTTPGKPRSKTTPKRPANAAKGKTPAPKSASKELASDRAAVEAQHLVNQLEAVQNIGQAMASTVGFDALIETVVPEISRMLNAERSTLFLLDDASGELWSKVAQGESSTRIQLKSGEGLAGWVAAAERPLHVADAYDDDRFNPEVDRKTGFRTRSVAAVPIFNRGRQLLGVIQVLNSRSGEFSEHDVSLLETIAAQTSFAIENARLSEELIWQNRKLDSARRRAEQRRSELDLLFQLEKETSAFTELDEMLDSMIVRVCERLRSRAGSILLSEEGTGRLFFRGVSGLEAEALKEVVLEPGDGVVGWVAERGEPVIVNNPEDDPRHDLGLADAIEFPAEAILAVPLVWDKKVIGAVEVLNPFTGEQDKRGTYNLEDLKILTVIAGQIARAVAHAQARQEKDKTERLALMGRMLAGVAHDLRTPMTVISGYAQLMALDGQKEQREERCSRILRQIGEMTAMVGDILAFARGDSGLRTTSVDPALLARQVSDNLREQCGPREIHLEIEHHGPEVLVDEGRTKRIIYNLAKNAIEVLSTGETLRIEIRSTGKGLGIVVEDSGPGIPEDIRSKLFEPFVTSGKSDGTGLGLSIVQRFVEDHRGTVSVQSTPGRGSRFEIFLPEAEPSKANA